MGDTNRIIMGDDYKLKKIEYDNRLEKVVLKYTCTANNILPVFNDEFTDYKVVKVLNDNGFYTISIVANVANKINGYFKECSFEGIEELISIDLIRYTSELTTMKNMFKNCINLSYINTKRLDTTNVTDITGAFMNCESLKVVNLLTCDLSRINSLNDLFNGCKSMLYIELPEMKNVYYMSHTFANCESVKEINLSRINTSSTTIMTALFANDISLKTIVGINDLNVSKTLSLILSLSKISFLLS